MPGRPKNSRKSYLSKKERYYTVTDKDPVTGSLPNKESKKKDKVEEEKKED